jgi:glycosyltransferase involved in cell wall biosynthesis
MDPSGVPDYIKNLQNLIQGNLGAGGGVVEVPTGTPTANATPLTQSVSVTPSASVAAAASYGSLPYGQRKLKFMLVSTHCHQYTGYSKVSYGILRQLAKIPWLEVTHFGFQKFPNQQFADGYRPYPSNVSVIDACANEKPFEQGFGFKQLPDAIRQRKPDVIMIFNDMSVVGKFLVEIDKSGIPKNFKTWVYCDQVYTTQLQGYLDMLNMKAERIFAFTPFWKQCLKDQGVNRPIDVILHGFDPDMYKILPRNEIRKNMKIPEEAFVFLNVNRNQPRKRYDLLIMAFVELIVKYPTKPLFLMCICDKGEKGGWWLFEIYQRELRLRGVNVEQFGGRLMISSQDMVFKDEDINVFYNLADAGVNAAEGEGWGLCNFEQMGVGVPQVVPNLGGFKEFCKPDNSVLVEAKHRYYLPMVYSPVGGEAFAMDPHDLCLGMEEYVLNSKKRKEHGEAARKAVLGYTWERAVETLVRRLKQEKEDLEADA